MDYLQEREKQRKYDKAAISLNDYLGRYEPDLEEFVLLIDNAFENNYGANDRHRFNQLVYQRVPLTVEQCHPTSRAIVTMLGESMPAKKFATHVAEVLRNEYGEHNYLPFIIQLINELDDVTTK